MSDIWEQVDYPAAGSLASAVKASAGANDHRVYRVKSISVGVAAGANPSGILKASLLDGSTVLWNQTLQADANGCANIDLHDVDFRATAGNDLTLELTGTLDGNAQTSVAMSGNLVGSGIKYNEN